MIPSDFDESNLVLDKPPDMTADQCDPLCIQRGILTVPNDDDGKTVSHHPVILSCWKVTQNELDEINKTGRVWLAVLGDIMPPVILSGIKLRID